jgi:hypothetical protein
VEEEELVGEDVVDLSGLVVVVDHALPVVVRF